MLEKYTGNVVPISKDKTLRTCRKLLKNETMQMILHGKQCVSGGDNSDEVEEYIKNNTDFSKRMSASIRFALAEYEKKTGEVL